MKHIFKIAGLCCLFVPFVAQANPPVKYKVVTPEQLAEMGVHKMVTLNALSDKGAGKKLGTVKFYDSPYGLMIEPDLMGLPQGMHGFHVHENPSCDHVEHNEEIIKGGKAGGHFDPDHTGLHNGPYQAGHKGDLPALYADKEGKANIPGLAPKLTLDELKNVSIMIHEMGDNYTDMPMANGGGGHMIACGVVKE